MATGPVLDAQVALAKQRAEQVASQKADGASLIFKVVTACLMILEVWWLKYQIHKKDEELEAAKALLEKKKVEEEAAAADAAMRALTKEAQMHVAAARARVTEVETALLKLAVMKRQNEARARQVADAKSWGDLNKLAGVR